MCSELDPSLTLDSREEETSFTASMDSKGIITETNNSFNVYTVHTGLWVLLRHLHENEMKLYRFTSREGLGTTAPGSPLPHLSCYPPVSLHMVAYFTIQILTGGGVPLASCILSGHWSNHVSSRKAPQGFPSTINVPTV